MELRPRVDGARRTLYVRLFRRDRDFQCAQPVLSCDARWKVMQHVMNKILDFRQISVGETTQEVILQDSGSPGCGEESDWSFIDAANEQGTLRSHDFRAHIIGVDGLRKRIDVADRSAREF